MAKLTFGQEAIQHIINQGRIEMGIANTIKDASDSEKLNVICSSVLVVFEPKILFKLSNTPIPAPIPGISFPPDLNKLIPT
jgi:hypothetical protein